MIPSYINPQVTIAQLLRETENPTLDRLCAVVVGPSYETSFMSEDNLVWSDYEAGGTLEYARENSDGVAVAKADDSVVDEGSVNLQATDLRMKLYEKATGDTAHFVALVAGGVDYSGDILQYVNPGTGNLIHDADSDIPVNVYDLGRAPRTGDILKIESSDGSKSVEREVLSLLGMDTAAQFAASQYDGATELVAWELALTTKPAAYTLVAWSGDPAAQQEAMIEFVKMYGTPVPTGGLAVVLDITCTSAGTGNNNGATSVFAASAAGIPVAVTATSVGGVSTLVADFALAAGLTTDPSAIAVTHTDGKWTTGDRVVITITAAVSDQEALLMDLGVTYPFEFSGYYYDCSVQRKNSLLVVEVLTRDPVNDEWTVRISDTRGLMVPKVIVGAAEDFTTTSFLYDGCTVDFAFPADFINGESPEVGTHVGQKFSFAIAPPQRSTRQFDKIRLSAPLGPGFAAAPVTVTAWVAGDFSIPATDPVNGATNYTVGADSVVLGSLNAPVSGYTGLINSIKVAEDGYGQVALEWRALEAIADTETVFSVDSLADIDAHCGSRSKESELGFGLVQAFTGSQGKRVYGLRVGGTDLAAFTTAFQKLETVTSVYAIAVLTTDEDVMKLASDHCERMSAPSVKRFRRAYVATDSPGEFLLTATDDDGELLTATLLEGVGGVVNLLEFTNTNLNLTTSGVRVGDKIKFVTSDATYTVASITGPKTLIIAKTDADKIDLAEVCEAWAADSAYNNLRYAWERSARLGITSDQQRRISNIWIDRGYFKDSAGAVDYRSNRFLACEIAGIRSALQPQQSLTRTEVTTITDAPSMYTLYTQELLNEAAARGVWIVTQDNPDAPVFIRHQITTMVSSGALYYEDSVGVNLDSISFAVNDIYEPLIGKRNVSAKTVIEIKNALISLLNDLTQMDHDSTIGPQLVNFYDQEGNMGTVTVEVHPDFKDRIRVYALLEMPLPLNNIEVVLEATTVFSETGEALNVITTA